MGEFVLILVIYYANAPGPTSILFPSKEACEAARDQSVKEFDGWPYGRARAVCVARNAP